MKAQLFTFVSLFALSLSSQAGQCVAGDLDAIHKAGFEKHLQPLFGDHALHAGTKYAAGYVMDGVNGSFELSVGNHPKTLKLGMGMMSAPISQICVDGAQIKIHVKHQIKSFELVVETEDELKASFGSQEILLTEFEPLEDSPPVASHKGSQGGLR